MENRKKVVLNKMSFPKSVIGDDNFKYNVILNLIQDLQRLLCWLRNSVRGRFQIKFGMTSLCDNGFTLIELLIVVLIIGILAAVALPQYQKAVLKTRLIGALTACDTLFKGAQLYYQTNGTWPTTFDEFDIEMPGSLNDSKDRLTGNNFLCRYVSSDTPSIMCNLRQEEKDLSIGVRQFFVNRRQYCYASENENFYNQVCKSFSGVNKPTMTSANRNYYKISSI